MIKEKEIYFCYKVYVLFRALPKKNETLAIPLSPHVFRGRKCIMTGEKKKGYFLCSVVDLQSFSKSLVLWGEKKVAKLLR